MLEHTNPRPFLAALSLVRSLFQSSLFPRCWAPITSPITLLHLSSSALVYLARAPGGFDAKHFCPLSSDSQRADREVLAGHEGRDASNNELFSRRRTATITSAESPDHLGTRDFLRLQPLGHRLRPLNSLHFAFQKVSRRCTRPDRSGNAAALRMC